MSDEEKELAALFFGRRCGRKIRREALLTKYDATRHTFLDMTAYPLGPDAGAYQDFHPFSSEEEWVVVINSCDVESGLRSGGCHVGEG